MLRAIDEVHEDSSFGGKVSVSRYVARPARGKRRRPWSRSIFGLVAAVLACCPATGLRAQNISTVPAPERAAPAPVQVVASFTERPTGVAVSKSGRVFVCFPNWSATHTNSVVELKPGKEPVPYPNAVWNLQGSPSIDPAHRFVCVQSVYADADDKLWVLDPAAPNLGAIVPGGAKLLEIDLKSNTVQRVYAFDPAAAPDRSYLNDVRVDTVRRFAYISDSGLGAILVVDLRTGNTRRVLNQVPETLGTHGIVITVDGNELQQSSGLAFTINCDGIALDPMSNTLYFEAPTNGNLYAIATADLRDASLDDAALAKRIKFVANIGPADGFSTGPDGNLYVTDVEGHAIRRVNIGETPLLTVVVNDPGLIWPDSMAWSSDGALYITASQIGRMARFNGGQDLAALPYHLFRSQPLAPVQPDLVTPPPP